MKEKKIKILTLMIMLACAAMVAAFSVPVNAAVTGICSTCHTMHDTQGETSDMGTTGQQKYLTLYSCLACHTTDGATNAPKIDGTASADGTGSGALMTAGGDYDLGTQGQRHDLVAEDSWALAPPGYSGALTDWATEKVTCEGAYGCHGKHPTVSPGVGGFHHGSETAYRWLYVQAGNTGADGVAVNGKESAIWEAGGAALNNHNVYDSDGEDSISAFCANCHGDFHSSDNTGAASPFTRHPTDEEALIANIDPETPFTPTAAQLDQTPFAFTSAEIAAGMLTTDMTTGTEYTTANGKAMCMSCHRAHGTNVDDILRFTYNMNAGDSINDAGCETCHVAQR